jgi:hypothetical protein
MTRSIVLSKASNVIKQLWIRRTPHGYTASIEWLGDVMGMKQVPLFGTPICLVDNPTPMIAKRLDEVGFTGSLDYLTKYDLL